MTTEKEQLEAEISERDARIAELEAIVPIESNLRAKAERVAAELDRELAALKAQQPSAGAALPDLITELKKQAEEIAQKGHAGWGNTMLLAAEALSVAGVALPERAEAERKAAELREERDILQRQLDRFYSQSHGIPALSEIERLHAQIATLKEIRMPILPPQCTDKLHHVKYRAGWNCCLSEVARLNPCRAQAVPDGYVLVPVEPTEIMQDAGCAAMPTADCHPYDAGMVYKAMLAAAPSAKKESDDE